MTRIFVAADFDDAFLDAAAAIPLSEGRRVRRDLMHVTLRFFGAIDDARLDELRASVERLPASRIDVRATRLDAFASPRKAHVLVLPIEDDGSLARIHETLGKEERPYRPHLTLARFKRPTDVRRTVEEARVDLAGRVVAFTLYASVLGKQGPTYTPLARTTLVGAASS